MPHFNFTEDLEDRARILEQLKMLAEKHENGERLVICDVSGDGVWIEKDKSPTCGILLKEALANMIVHTEKQI